MLSQLWTTFAFLPLILIYTIKLLKTIFISTGKIVKIDFCAVTSDGFLTSLESGWKSWYLSW